MRRVAAVPNSDSVAVYTEGCVLWSYPAYGDRGEGGEGGEHQVKRRRRRACMWIELIVESITILDLAQN